MYTYQSTLFDTPRDAAECAVEEYLSAGGSNDENDIRETLLAVSPEEMAREMIKNGFIPQPMPLADDIPADEWEYLFTAELRRQRENVSAEET